MLTSLRYKNKHLHSILWLELSQPGGINNFNLQHFLPIKFKEAFIFHIIFN